MIRYVVAVASAVQGCALLGTAWHVTAQDAYPAKLIRLILPYAPGGNTSTLGRLVGNKLTESWGQQVLMDNRPGGNTIIGTEALLRYPTDGYTILLTTATHTILAPTPYDPIKDFTPVATLTSSEKVLVTHPSLPVRNLRALISLAKSRPEQLNFSSPGAGGLQHLAGEMFNILADVRIQHIPYKGGAQAVSELIGGQVQLSFQNSIAVLAHVKLGRLRGIAVSGENRLLSLPEVPTFRESGLAGFEVNTWFGVLARAGVAGGIVNKLSAEIARILQSPDVRATLLSLEMYPFISTPEQFAALMRSDLAKYSKIIKTAKIKLDSY